MKRILICLFTTLSTIAHAESLEAIKAKNFSDQLQAYNLKNTENQELLVKYSKKENASESETEMYFMTICNSVYNLERAEKLIIDNPQYAVYLDGNVLPSIQDNLDFARRLERVLMGTQNQCR